MPPISFLLFIRTGPGKFEICTLSTICLSRGSLYVCSCDPHHVHHVHPAVVMMHRVRPQDGLLFVLGFVVVEVLLASAVKISASGFITRWWNWSPNDCSGRGEQFKVRDVIRKKRDYVGKIPKLGGWVWPKPTSWCLLTKLFLACQNDSEVLKHVLQKGGRWYLINFNT